MRAAKNKTIYIIGFRGLSESGDTGRTGEISVLLQVNGQKGNTTADYTETIQNIARQFGISEDDMNINKEYLAANYVDPATIPVIVGIMLIVVLAGIITIYSVYYVSMNQRVREFGKLKAIGATKRQLRQIVLREGMGVALFAIPIGL